MQLPNYYTEQRERQESLSDGKKSKPSRAAMQYVRHGLGLKAAISLFHDQRKPIDREVLTGDRFVEEVLEGRTDFDNVVLSSKDTLCRYERFDSQFGLLGAEISDDLKEEFNHYLECDPHSSMLSMKDTILSGADLSHLYFSNSDFEGAWMFRTNLSHTNLEQANLRRAQMRDTNLEYAELRLADLVGCDLERAELRFANIRGAKLGGASLLHSDFRGTDVSWTNLTEGRGFPTIIIDEKTIMTQKQYDHIMHYRSRNDDVLDSINIELRLEDVEPIIAPESKYLTEFLTHFYPSMEFLTA